MMINKLVPKGDYCYHRTAEIVYTETGVIIGEHCPYWSSDLTLPEQLSGKCQLLGINDNMEGLKYPPILWDQLKICGINR